MGLIYAFYCLLAFIGAFFLALLGSYIAAIIDKSIWVGAIIGAVIGILLVSFWLWWVNDIKPAQEYRQLREQSSEANSLYNIGAEYENKGEYDQALDYYNQALEMQRELGDEWGWALGRTLYSIGAVHEKKEHFDQALDYYNQALVVYREIGDPIGERRTLGAIENLPSE